MVSEKLDRVIAAEEAAEAKVQDAEKKAYVIIEEAKVRAAQIRAQKVTEARDEARRLVENTETECARIIEDYRQKAEAEADKIARDAAKNEMFGMNTVITKIIP